MDSASPVFISESLTPYKKKLFGEVNKLKKYLNRKFTWTHNESEEAETPSSVKFYLAKFEENHRHRVSKLCIYKVMRSSIRTLCCISCDH